MDRWPPTPGISSGVQREQLRPSGVGYDGPGHLQRPRQFIGTLEQIRRGQGLRHGGDPERPLEQRLPTGAWVVAPNPQEVVVRELVSADMRERELRRVAEVLEMHDHLPAAVAAAAQLARAECLGRGVPLAQVSAGSRTP